MPAAFLVENGQLQRKPTFSGSFETGSKVPIWDHALIDFLDQNAGCRDPHVWRQGSLRPYGVVPTQSLGVR